MQIEENASLQKLTSLHVGGAAKYLARVHNDAEVREALRLAHEKRVPFFILGKGSNTLFPDAGFPGVVILMYDRSLTADGTTVTAASGVFMRQLVNFSLEHGLRGAEELAGIPGTVGGAVRGNAGTWRTEIKDILTRVEFLDFNQATGEASARSLPGSACEFGYRHSIFKLHHNWVVLRAAFALRVGDVAAGHAQVALDLTERHRRQPYNAPSAGSIFKNPDKTGGIFAGALIEQCGLKGARRGGAEISEKHGNFILNRGGARSSDIQELISLAQDEVRKKFAIDLAPEIEIVSPRPLSDGIN